MKNQLVNIIVRKIKDGEINPNTGEAFKVEDIKRYDYREKVQEILKL